MQHSSFIENLRSIRSRYGIRTIATAVVLCTFGLTSIIFGTANSAQPQPIYTPVDRSGASSAPTLADHTSASALGYAEPTSIHIPAIDVSSEIIHLGKNQDNTLAVPSGPDVTKVAWYKHSPAPGQIGSSVMSGHFDQVGGVPNVFFRLGELQLGDNIDIERSDGSIAEFVVTDKQKYPKESFPSDEVYGASETPTLRLITCGGEFLPAVDDYDSNIVIYAEMKSVKTP